jgi:hypothetical protein
LYKTRIKIISIHDCGRWFLIGPFYGNFQDNCSKPLIGSIQYQQTIMIHTKRVIFMILPLLFVPLVYGMSSTPDACAAPPDSRWESGNCTDDEVTYTGVAIKKTCCWREKIPGSILGETYCQQCTRNLMTGTWDCQQKELQFLEQPPTPPTPVGPFAPPLSAGVLEQPLTATTPPPLFGRNVPLQGGVFGQPSITTATPIPTPPPLFGQATPEGPTPAEEGEDIQPMNTTFPTPQPFPPPTPGFKGPQTSIDISPDLAPEDDQDETDDGRKDIIPDTGIAEQPEIQQPQEPTNEGQDTAGPLT